MSDHSKFAVIVHYPKTDDELKDHQASPTEKLSALKTRVLPAFSLQEGVDGEGELIEYGFLHDGKPVRNLNKTTGDLADGKHELKLKLERERHFFFYKDKGNKIVSELPKATGMQIKEMIKAEFSDVNLEYDLVLEGEGHKEDEAIANAQVVPLEVDKQHKPKTFFVRPPTNFGS